MEQKLYYLELPQDSGREIQFPQNLQALLADGWYIHQVSAYGYKVNYGCESCVLLLQRDNK